MLFKFCFKRKKKKNHRHIKILFACNLCKKPKKKEIFTWNWSHQVLGCTGLQLADPGSFKALFLCLLVKLTPMKDLKDYFFPLCSLKQVKRA